MTISIKTSKPHSHTLIKLRKKKKIKVIEKPDKQVILSSKSNNERGNFSKETLEAKRRWLYSKLLTPNLNPAVMAFNGTGKRIYFLCFFKNKFIYLFILAVLGLHCCAWAFSSCGKWGATLCCGAQASHCSGGAWALGAWASVVAAHGLSSCGLQALERRLSSCGACA